MGYLKNSTKFYVSLLILNWLSHSRPIVRNRLQFGNRMEECQKKNGLFYVDLRAYLLSKRNNANETTKEL